MKKQQTNMKKIIATVMIIICINLIIAFVLFYMEMPPITEQKKSNKIIKNSDENNHKIKRLSIEIWSKAAIGQYFWEDIFQGNIHTENNYYLEGHYNMNKMSILFRSGASLKIESLNAFQNIENLVLILNWRTKESVERTIDWLDAALSKPKLKNLAIIALGNEQCHNSWFERWLSSKSKNNHKFRFLFIVYDWSKIDNNQYYQWPLGVATYRNFQNINNITSLIYDSRPFICNYVGTVYSGTSREELEKLFNKNNILKESCILRTRSKWISNESNESMELYRDALKKSDLTLNPIGMNHECYRIYEAASFGSIPVIEINLKHHKNTSCDRSNVFRLFQQTNAPFIYVHNWTYEIVEIINKQLQKTHQQKINERIELIKWYERFKIFNKNRFLNALNDKFL